MGLSRGYAFLFASMTVDNICINPLNQQKNGSVFIHVAKARILERENDLKADCYAIDLYVYEQIQTLKKNIQLFIFVFWHKQSVFRLHASAEYSSFQKSPSSSAYNVSSFRISTQS
jgi:hypothetical protein